MFRYAPREQSHMQSTETYSNIPKRTYHVTLNEVKKFGVPKLSKWTIQDPIKLLIQIVRINPFIES